MIFIASILNIFEAVIFKRYPDLWLVSLHNLNKKCTIFNLQINDSLQLIFGKFLSDNSACDFVPGDHGGLRVRRSAAVRRVGEFGLPGRLLFLLHLAEYHRLRRHRARRQDLRFQGAGREFHPLLDVPDAGDGHHRNVLQPDAGGGDPQVPLVRQGHKELLRMRRQGRRRRRRPRRVNRFFLEPVASDSDLLRGCT